MAIFGLSKKTKKSTKKSATKSKTKKSGSKEAKALLAKMKAKNDSGDCAFC